MFCTPYAYSLNPTHARAYRHHNTNGPCYVTLTSIPGTCVLQLYVILPVKLKKCPLLLSRSMLKLQRSSVAFQIYAQITKILCFSPDRCSNHKDHLLLSRSMSKSQLQFHQDISNPRRLHEASMFWPIVGSKEKAIKNSEERAYSGPWQFGCVCWRFSWSVPQDVCVCVCDGRYCGLIYSQTLMCLLVCLDATPLSCKHLSNKTNVAHLNVSFLFALLQSPFFPSVSAAKTAS
jgi:hypothetical protein